MPLVVLVFPGARDVVKCCGRNRDPGSWWRSARRLCGHRALWLQDTTLRLGNSRGMLREEPHFVFAKG
jgi:hypothetical protein